MFNHQKYIYNHPHVIHEDFDGEVVIINLKTGAYYSLSETARAIWKAIEGGALFEEITNRIMERFHGNIQSLTQDIQKFIDELIKEDLIRTLKYSGTNPLNQSNASQKNNSDLRKPFRTPEIKKYTDQQELLLLDPIHEVGDLGWPEKKADSSGSDDLS